MEEYIPTEVKPVLAEQWRPRKLHEMLDLLMNLNEAGYAIELGGQNALLLNMCGDTLHRVEDHQYVVLDSEGRVEVLETTEFKRKFKHNHG